MAFVIRVVNNNWTVSGWPSGNPGFLCIREGKFDVTCIPEKALHFHRRRDAQDLLQLEKVAYSGSVEEI